MTEFWIVRHTATAVEPGTCYGRLDVGLRETFPAEAAAVAAQLDGIAFDEVWSSPLSRCRRLAAACGYADPRTDDRLLEIDFGAWEGQRFDAIDDPQLQKWYADYLHVRPTGGESFEEQCRRVAAFLAERSVACPRGRVVLFSHGGVQLAAGLHAGLYAPETAFEHILPYGSILKLQIAEN